MSGTTIVVDRRGARQRLDRFLADVGTWGSRAQVQRLIAAGHVHVDGRPAKADTVLKIDQQIEVTDGPVAAPPPKAEPEAIPLEVLFEDRWLLVLNKPAGLVVHPAAGNWSGTLVNALLYHWGGRPSGLDDVRPGVAHRLDKETSGVLVVAKDPDTLRKLADQFRDREVEKVYLAFVVGRPRGRRGKIEEPIGRHPVDRKRMAIREDGRAASTEWEVIGGDQRVTLLRVRPKTGRTHQIRVHLAAIGHPIVGDKVYGRDRSGGPRLARHALHAASLTFTHPASGERLRFEAPLPAELEDLRRSFTI